MKSSQICPSSVLSSPSVFLILTFFLRPLLLTLGGLSSTSGDASYIYLLLLNDIGCRLFFYSNLLKMQLDYGCWTAFEGWDDWLSLIWFCYGSYSFYSEERGSSYYMAWLWSCSSCCICVLRINYQLLSNAQIQNY